MSAADRAPEVVDLTFREITGMSLDPVDEAIDTLERTVALLTEHLEAMLARLNSQEARLHLARRSRRHRLHS